ncbi:hypothetical protein [Streptomyces sp. SPB162]|uniref:hypothetical protein n=1 Tax=Streptomyces sp. SPB162 TaxID=2940560 RepID=UPI00240691AD|nr:hypothetical protein [Streptomyces sp. SPB162]
MIDVPGLTPRSPVITEGPVLVTDSPANTAKLSAVASGTGVAMAWAGLDAMATITAAMVAAIKAAIQAEIARALGTTGVLNVIDRPTPMWGSGVWALFVTRKRPLLSLE